MIISAAMNELQYLLVEINSHFIAYEFDRHAGPFEYGAGIAAGINKSDISQLISKRPISLGEAFHLNKNGSLGPNHALRR